jgi:hypothetical protein
MQMPMLLLSLTVLGLLVFSQAQAKVLPGRAGKFFDWEALPPAQYDVSSRITSLPACVAVCIASLSPFTGTLIFPAQNKMTI